MTKADEGDGAATSAKGSSIADALSIASDFGAAWTALALVQVLTRRATLRDAALRLGTAGVVSLVLTRWLKHRYAIPRSAVTTRRSTARTPSSERFPSGHTLAAFTAALVVPRSTWGRLLGLGFAATVAWARVRVGHHRPVDVVAGAGVGALAGAAITAALPG